MTNTNYNQRQNIETQLEFPGMELEAIAEATSQPTQPRVRGLRPKTYGIIGAIALTLGAVGYGVYDFNKTMNQMDVMIKFSKINVAEDIAHLVLGNPDSNKKQPNKENYSNKK